uniref:Uncharacterized protein n=1 Tax=Anguilla anguilla TaxID=7936 RepID=A0A0E9RX83_ANGAN
MSQRQKQQG